VYRVVVALFLTTALSLAVAAYGVHTPDVCGIVDGVSQLAETSSRTLAAQGFNRTYGGTGHDYAYDLVQTSDGGYALLGYTFPNPIGNINSWLVKTDANGNMEWNKTYGGTGWEYAYDLVQTSDGGYALAGYTQSYGAGGGDAWLVKTDANGNMEWNKTYGGTSSDYAKALVQTIDGGYALAGSTESFGAGAADYWLVKSDAEGNVQWNKTYGGTGDDKAEALVQTSDGGYALAGGSGSFGTADFWLVKTDENDVISEFPSALMVFILLATVSLVATIAKQKCKSGFPRPRRAP